jgi:hypothetical protein
MGRYKKVSACLAPYRADIEKLFSLYIPKRADIKKYSACLSPKRADIDKLFGLFIS